MANTARIFITDICQHIQSLIKTNLFSTLSLKYVSFGSLLDVVANAAWTDNVPIVIVTMMEPVVGEAAELSNFLFVYPVRVVYVRQFGDQENFTQQKAAALETLGEYLMDKRCLPDLSLDNAQVVNSWVSSLEMVPPEEGVVEALSADLKAAALTLTVQVHVRT